MNHLIIQCCCLLAIVLLIMMLAQKIRIAYPILLVLAGLPLGFVPFFKGFEIEPNIIFLIFLPPLLYDEAWKTSWKDLWKWRRVISSFAFPIVIITACVVAVVSHSLIPGFTLALGFLLGGIISPPDAVSASAVLKNVKVPRRLLTIVEGESMMNDASSLIVFRFALAAVATGTFVFSDAAVSFVVVIVMGILTGIVVGMVFYAIHRWMPTTPDIDVALTFLTPYAMYVAAEQFHFSGVLAVVSGGLFLSARRDSILTQRSRLQGINVWEVVSFMLNGFIFMLIGLEFPVVIKALGPQELTDAIKYSLIITGVLVTTRLLSTLGASAFTVFISRYIQTADSRPGWKAPILFGWAGMRGAVSLAAALSIPIYLKSGEAFPQRNMILFITFTVILVTLVFQGLTLPLLVRWVKMPDPDATMSFEQQRQIVRKKISYMTLQLLEQKYPEQVKNNDMVKALQLRYNADMELLKDWQKENLTERADGYYKEYRDIMADLMNAQRHLLKDLNKKEEVNGDIIRQQLDLLDLEEEKMRQHFNNGTEA